MQSNLKISQDCIAENQVHGGQGSNHMNCMLNQQQKQIVLLDMPSWHGVFDIKWADTVLY